MLSCFSDSHCLWNLLLPDAWPATFKASIAKLGKGPDKNILVPLAILSNKLMFMLSQCSTSLFTSFLGLGLFFIFYVYVKQLPNPFSHCNPLHQRFHLKPPPSLEWELPTVTISYCVLLRLLGFLWTVSLLFLTHTTTNTQVLPLLSTWCYLNCCSYSCTHWECEISDCGIQGLHLHQKSVKILHRKSST